MALSSTRKIRTTGLLSEQVRIRGERPPWFFDSAKVLRGGSKGYTALT